VLLKGCRLIVYLIAIIIAWSRSVEPFQSDSGSLKTCVAHGKNAVCLRKHLRTPLGCIEHMLVLSSERNGTSRLTI
jgi:hypothetical protein